MSKKKVSTSWFGVPESDDPIQAHTSAVRLLAQGMALLWGVVDLAYLGLFAAVGPAVLVWGHAAGVVLCGAALALTARGQLAWAWSLMAVAMVGQAGLSVMVLGWGSGFQYGVLLGIPWLMGGPIRSFGRKAVSALAVLVVYVVLDLVWRQRGESALIVAERLQEALHYFNVTSALLVLLMWAGYAAQLLHESRLAMRRLMQVDALTGVRHRRALLEVAARENARAERGPIKLSVVLCSVDHLTEVNATHGWQIGDAVLQAVGGVMGKGVRDADTMLRWTGDEFLAILPDTDAAGAQVVAERLRRGVEALAVMAGRQSLAVGMTVGLATMLPGDRLEEAIERAQAAVSEGKQAGRRRIVSANSPRLA